MLIPVRCLRAPEIVISGPGDCYLGHISAAVFILNPEPCVSKEHFLQPEWRIGLGQSAAQYFNREHAVGKDSGFRSNCAVMCISADRYARSLYPLPP